MSGLNEIHRCKCPSEYQDSKYGSGMRVMNWSTKSETWRCTVCGMLKARGSVIPKSSETSSPKKGKKGKK